MTEPQKKTLGMAILSLVFGCLFFIPVLGFLFGITAIVLGIVALNLLKKNTEYKGSGLAIGGIVLGGISILIIPVIALLSAIAIPNLLRARRTANEAAARATVRSLTTAAETFATANNDVYPDSVAELETYITSIGNYCADDNGADTLVQGYIYKCWLTTDGYTFVASPANSGVTGSITYTGTTGGVLTPL